MYYIRILQVPIAGPSCGEMPFRQLSTKIEQRARAFYTLIRERRHQRVPNDFLRHLNPTCFWRHTLKDPFQSSAFWRLMMIYFKKLVKSLNYCDDYEII